ncbi:MAG: 5-(carboxyamino)imidazole ribonucleotide mutase [bacterium]|nr:5-(carboxyamino)imidazole ribonucleotide mutase [bacterium]
MKDVLIIMGSDSDLPVMKEAAEILDEMSISYHLTIISAHRTPARMFDEAKNARKNGYKCIIAGAGGAAHLPGMTASITDLPVIGVPIKSTNLSGMDSLYSIVQMPPGIPVGTMAINGAKNAGLFAAKILAISNPSIQNAIAKYSKNLELTVLGKANDLESKGYQKYLNQK